jgi:hypothetical protein
MRRVWWVGGIWKRLIGMMKESARLEKVLFKLITLLKIILDIF